VPYQDPPREERYGVKQRILAKAGACTCEKVAWRCACEGSADLSGSRRQRGSFGRHTDEASPSFRRLIPTASPPGKWHGLGAAALEAGRHESALQHNLRSELERDGELVPPLFGWDTHLPSVTPKALKFASAPDLNQPKRFRCSVAAIDPHPPSAAPAGERQGWTIHRSTLPSARWPPTRAGDG
jgi:hypothetical protein